MRRVLCAALYLSLAVTSTSAEQQEEAVIADEAVAEYGVVVELYTSQGCSACPPADEFLSRLDRRSGIIALALHVDYWDYIGWRDRFAQPQFTARQKAYAYAAGTRSIYTPQMIIGGTHRLEGLRPMDVADVIQQKAGQPSQVRFRLKRNGQMMEIVVEADPPLERSVNVDLVRYRESETVNIRGGENAGRTVTYHNIVTEWDTLGSWEGTGPVAFHVRIEGDEPAVVIVQENGPGAIVGAARMR
jgi:hypothetical protein